MNHKRKKFRFVRRINLHDDEIFLYLQNKVEADSDLGYVPAYCFDIYLFDTNENVGRCELRVGDTDQIYYAGNIGYTIYMKYRGNRYAMKASILLLELAKRHFMEKLIITCNPDNFASIRTCELLGARYIETVDIPSDNIMYRLGDRKKNIYEILL
ncbi:MAG: GNAT family N-acetyltransferase [Oscillospiraceae bacterium]|nr:GNAT family N-acetyltransferase [Oscillospiraceae bacterium]